MGDPQCSRISGKKNDYSQWERRLRFSLEQLKAEGENPLVVLSGDLVNNPGNREEWEALFEACDNVRKDHDFKIVSPTGNHGRVGGYETVPGFKERFILTGNGPLYHEDGFFSFDYGNAHFMILDSNFMDNTDRQASKYLGAWIKHDLATNRQPAAFAVMHHPMYSASTVYNNVERAKAVRDGYLRLMGRYGIDFILCGHEHIYCRTNQESAVTQVMGVSGDKHYHAKNADYFAIIKENVAITTLFHVNKDKIDMETFDEDGVLVDQYSQPIRHMAPRKCGNCENFDTCGGTGIFEKKEAEANAKAAGKSPLLPEVKNGIIVDGTTITDEELSKLEWKAYAFSVRRKGKLRQETKFGFRLSDIIDRDAYSLTVINEAGRRFRYKYSEMISAKCYAVDGKGNIDKEIIVPPVIYLDESDDTTYRSKYRLAVGQRNPKQYNGRGWIRNIVEIEVQHEIP